MPDDIGKVRSQVGRFLTETPLYGRVQVARLGDSNVEQYFPTTVSRMCEGCDRETNWEESGVISLGGAFCQAIYRCRNCGQRELRVWLMWLVGTQGMCLDKVGQFPKFVVQPRKEVAKALGEHVELYRKAMTSRHQNYGLGAASYFRRLIEETTDDMLDLVIAAFQDIGDEGSVIPKLQEAKKDKRFENKVKLIADVLPTHLCPGGTNPFAVLHSLLSAGLHGRSEEECIEIADGIDSVLGFIYVELKAHAAERRSYAEGLKALAAKLSKR